MRVSNKQSSINTLRLFMSNMKSTQVQVGKINTGSYLYVITAVYEVGYNLFYCVNRYTTNWVEAGSVIVDATNYGIQYDRAGLGGASIPDSVAKEILNFNRAVYA